MKKVGKVLGNIAITFILIFSIIMTVVVITSSKSESGLPNLATPKSIAATRMNEMILLTFFIFIHSFLSTNKYITKMYVVSN